MVSSDAISVLNQHNVDFAFLYLAYLDESGHKNGWMSDGYMEALENSWANITRVINEIPEDCVIHKGGYKARTEQSSYGSYDTGYGTGYNYDQRRQPTAQQLARQAQIKRSEASTITASVKSATPSLELNKGDMVLHAAFGKGMVLSVMKMGGDALLEIAFDDIGTKKLMAKTASAHMKKM